MRKKLTSIALTCVLSTTPALAMEAGDPAYDFSCGATATAGERSLCAVLAPVVLFWPLTVTVAEAVGDAYEGACVAAGFEYLSPEEQGVESGWKCTGLPRRDG